MMKKWRYFVRFVSGTKPDKENFPMRNRLIGIVRCGDHHRVKSPRRFYHQQQEFANDFNKDVFALPGNVTESLSEGCNKLIKQNKAHFIRVSWWCRLHHAMGWVGYKKKTSSKQLFVEMNESESALYDLLKSEKKWLLIEFPIPWRKHHQKHLLYYWNGIQRIGKTTSRKKFILA